MQAITRHGPQARAGSTRRSAGFTLIELMIVVAVIAILASIAYPSYTQYVERARRTDAMSGLSNIAGQLERCYTVNTDYTATNCPSGTNIPTEEEFYLIDISASSASYTITATPQGAQANDSCGSFSLNHQGVRLPNECW
nr:type IV pilin protein [Halomonas daqiaonensis]